MSNTNETEHRGAPVQNNKRQAIWDVDRKAPETGADVEKVLGHFIEERLPQREGWSFQFGVEACFYPSRGMFPNPGHSWCIWVLQAPAQIYQDPPTKPNTAMWLNGQYQPWDKNVPQLTSCGKHLIKTIERISRYFPNDIIMRLGLTDPRLGLIKPIKIMDTADKLLLLD